MRLALITLLSGLAISAVAIYYSVIGLAAIFAAAVIPIMIMGTILECSKLVSAWWLKKNWKRAPKVLKYYMLCAVIVLMFITSMGIFGFLSKAHVEQGVPTGDIVAQIESFDEQIELEQRIIEQSKNSLSILDDQIKQYTELGYVSKGVKARQDQKEERDFLNNAVRESQQKITELRREKLPVAGQLRAVEAEVGPVKYIAQLIYGDNPDSTLLEKAVVRVIITLVFVFDPLAVLLLLAAQLSFQWYREEKENNAVPAEKIETPPQTETPAEIPVEEESDDSIQSEDEGEDEINHEDVHVTGVDAKFIFNSDTVASVAPVFRGGFSNSPKLEPLVYKPEQNGQESVLTESAKETILDNITDNTFIRTNDSMENANEEVERSAETDSTITNIEDTIDIEVQTKLNVASEEVVQDDLSQEVEEQSIEASVEDDSPQKDEIIENNLEVPLKQDLDTNIKDTDINNNPAPVLEKLLNQEQPETAAPQQQEIQGEELKKKAPVSWIERTPTGQQVKKTTE